MKKILFIYVMLAGMATLHADEMNIRRLNFSDILTPPQKSSAARPLGIQVPYRTLYLDAADVHKAFFTPTDYLIVDNFPVTEKLNSTVHLRRKSTTIIDPSTRWHLGDGRIIPTPAMQIYTGFDEKDPKSKIVLLYGQGQIIGSIRSSDGIIRTLGPTWSDIANKGEHALAESDGIESLKNFRCMNDMLPSTSNDDDSHSADPIKVPTFGDMLEIDVAFEIDYPVYLKVRRSNLSEEENLSNTILYVASLLAQSSAMYEDEVNVSLKLAPDPWMWLTDSDPGYPGYQDDDVKTDAGEILSRFARRRRTQNDTRDIAHLVTSVTGNASVYAAGVAYSGSNYSGTICSRQLGYGISSINVNVNWPILGYVWDAMVCTHEMGHNFGSPHTHYCSSDSPWPNRVPLDTCVVQNGPAATGDACNLPDSRRRCPDFGGTIMSYCHLGTCSNARMNLEFTPIVAAQIRKGAERGRSSCVTTPSSPIVKLQYPLGRNSFRAGTLDSIRFISQNVTSVIAEYSTDNMNTWKRIASNIPAAERRVPWTIPSEATTAGFVRVMDANNSAIGDTSWVGFSIAAVTLQLQEPKGGETFGQSETITIAWSQSLVTTLFVEYSTDGGVTWNLIRQVTSSQSASSGSTEWQPGTAQSPTVIVRVRTADNIVLSQTSPMTVAKEALDLLEPTGGETLCAGKQYELQWWPRNFGSDNSIARLDYSLNNGQTWNRIAGAATQIIAGKRTWTVPSSVTASNEGRVRIMFLSDGDTVVQSISEKITFGTGNDCIVLSVDDLSSYITQSTLTPTPVKDNATLALSITRQLEDLTVEVFDVQGKKLQTIANVNAVQQGDRNIQLDMNFLVNGSYTLIIRSGNRTMSLPFIVQR